MYFEGVVIFHTLLFAAWMRELRHSCSPPKGPNEWRNIPFWTTFDILSPSVLSISFRINEIFLWLKLLIRDMRGSLCRLEWQANEVEIGKIMTNTSTSHGLKNMIFLQQAFATKQFLNAYFTSNLFSNHSAINLCHQFLQYFILYQLWISYQSGSIHLFFLHLKIVLFWSRC